MCEINDESGKLVRGQAKKIDVNEMRVMNELRTYDPRDCNCKCGLQKYIDECHKTAVDHGFWSDEIKGKRDEVNLKTGAAFVQITNLIEHIRKGDDNSHLFYEEPTCNQDQWIDNKLLLIATEISEALQADMKEELVEELADVFIRLMDLVGYVYRGSTDHVPFDEVVQNKMRENEKRPYLHGKEC